MATEKQINFLKDLLNDKAQNAANEAEVSYRTMGINLTKIAMEAKIYGRTFATSSDPKQALEIKRSIYTATLGWITAGMPMSISESTNPKLVSSYIDAMKYRKLSIFEFYAVLTA